MCPGRAPGVRRGTGRGRDEREAGGRAILAGRSGGWGLREAERRGEVEMVLRYAWGAGQGGWRPRCGRLRSRPNV